MQRVALATARACQPLQRHKSMSYFSEHARERMGYMAFLHTPCTESMRRLIPSLPSVRPYGSVLLSPPPICVRSRLQAILADPSAFAAASGGGGGGDAPAAEEKKEEEEEEEEVVGGMSMFGEEAGGGDY